MTCYGVFGHFWGELVSCLLSKKVQNPPSLFNSSEESLLNWVVGLEIHLLISFGLYILFGIPVLNAYWLSFAICLLLPIFFIPRLVKPKAAFEGFFNLSSFKSLTLNGVLFFYIIFWIGITIFSYSGEIKTLWVNNYGDLPIHLGLIFNYIYGPTPLREYHIFPGEYLSYSVLPDFWSALLLSSFPSMRILKVVFVLQWTIIWLFSLISLSKNGHKIFPWVVLLGGGTLAQFLANIDLYHLSDGLKGYSHSLIDKGFPVADLLSCIWIPQRTSLYGLFTLAVGMSAFSKYYMRRSREDCDCYSRSKLMFKLATLFGISFLANFHMALVACLIIGFYLLYDVFFNPISYLKLNKYSLPLLSFILPSTIFVTIGYLHYSGKSNMVKFVSGWMLGEQQTFFALSKMWSINFTILLLPIVYFMYHLPRRMIVILISLFILGNYVSLSNWNWDNYKLFIGLFVSLLIMAGSRCRPKDSIGLILFLSICPGIYEFSRIFLVDEENPIYSIELVKQSEQIRLNTPNTAIIAGDPIHNSPILLAGRVMYYGYPGWLVSHGILGEAERAAINQSVTAILNCKQSPGVCPDYVLAGGPLNKEELARLGFLNTGMFGLYKVPR